MGRAGEKGLVLVTYLLSQFPKLPCSTLLWTNRDEESKVEELPWLSRKPKGYHRLGDPDTPASCWYWGLCPLGLNDVC